MVLTNYTHTQADKWLTETEAAQAKLALHEKPVLTVAAINEQFSKFEKRQKSLRKLLHSSSFFFSLRIIFVLAISRKIN